MNYILFKGGEQVIEVGGGGGGGGGGAGADPGGHGGQMTPLQPENDGKLQKKMSHLA